MDIAMILSFVVGIIGVLTGVASLFISAPKTRVDTLDAIVDTLAEENKRLRERVAELEREQEQSRAYIDRLIRQLRDNDIEPVAPPWKENETPAPRKSGLRNWL